MTVLTGELPSTELGAQFKLSDLHLPEELPLSLPSKLVQQRPDVRAQEALLHAASAEIGVATARLFPDFTINASVGSIATRLGDLFVPGSAIWSFGGNLLQPVFHGGELIHKQRAARGGLRTGGSSIPEHCFTGIPKRCRYLERTGI